MAKVKQPTKAPTKKVASMEMSGALILVVSFIANLAGVEVPMEVAIAFTVVLMGVVGWLTPEDPETLSATVVE